VRYTQKLKKIGNFIGSIIPTQILEMLQVGIGSEVFIEQIQDKLIIEKENSSNISSDFLKAADSIANKYQKTFMELANK
jgi:antitoxin component of MazEF toxin-antitoxin module